MFLWVFLLLSFLWNVFAVCTISDYFLSFTAHPLSMTHTCSPPSCFTSCFTCAIKAETTSTRLGKLPVLMPRPGQNDPHFKNNGDNGSLRRKGAHPRQSVLSPCKAFQPATHPLRRRCSSSRAGASDSGWIHSREKCEERNRAKSLPWDGPTGAESFRSSCVWGKCLDLSLTFSTEIKKNPPMWSALSRLHLLACMLPIIMEKPTWINEYPSHFHPLSHWHHIQTNTLRGNYVCGWGFFLFSSPFVSIFNPTPNRQRNAAYFRVKPPTTTSTHTNTHTLPPTLPLSLLSEHLFVSQLKCEMDLYWSPSTWFPREPGESFESDLWCARLLAAEKHIGG